MDSASPGMLRPEASGIWFVARYFFQIKCQVRVCGMHPKPAVNQVVRPLKRFRISQTCMRRNAPRLLAPYQARKSPVRNAERQNGHWPNLPARTSETKRSRWRIYLGSIR